MKKEIRGAVAHDVIAGDEVTAMFNTLGGWVPITTSAYTLAHEEGVWIAGRRVNSVDIEVHKVVREVPIPQDCGVVIEAVVERRTGGPHGVRMMRVRDNYEDPSYWRACAPVGHDEHTSFTDDALVDFTIVALTEIPF